MLLAIDTSTDTASLALVRDETTLAELTWRSGQNHTTQLLPNLAHLFELTKTNQKALAAIIVALGPGSFNGLRVGVSAAKGLAFSLGIPIIGINSLEVAAYQYAETGLPVCAIFNAGRSEIATATYQKKYGRWQQLVAADIVTIEHLCSQTIKKTLFCGEYVPAIADQLKALLEEKAVIPPAITDIRRAGFLAELGHQRLQAGKVDNAATLQPIYLRRPPIGAPKKE
ncbi:MAG: tRNA (adenosine(37)-N6)-threonylcarbamoyltransferase complex dimerization subunit type 1 TsaB [Dehalococcoidales bacterium]|nr:tRNA (adenosine(37)-N6)-threonylcarbamoyltransferase complex dimerization subunit type 1 TsaB [Dehalococcoidales bacterium]